MRPLYLSMAAFGPYAGVQALDFGELKNRSFFLIHGPTGSGKTTILDAMCFALYGDTSGARDGKAMRSDYTDGSLLTEVVFDFAIGTDIYRVKRIPEQERPKKRGEGTTLKHAEAELYYLARPENSLIATGWSKVTEKIEELLGFKSAQFRQVVLLPQGDFRKLLTANSTERQEIMQTLFKTEQYRYIEDKLKIKAQDLKRSFEELVKERDWVLQEAAAAGRDELAARQEIDARVTDELNTELETARLTMEKAQQALAAARVIEAKFAEKKAAEQALAELSVKAPVVETYRRDLAKTLKAAGLLDAEKTLLSLANERQTLEQEETRLQTALQAAAAAQLTAEKRLAGEAARENERELAAQEVLQLNELTAKANDLAAALQTAELCRHQTCGAEKAKDLAVEKLNNAKTSYDEYSKQHKQQIEIAFQLSARQAGLADLRRVINLRCSLDEVRVNCLAAAKRLADEQLTMNSREKTLCEAKDHLKELQDLWASGQAGLMAATLVDGSPCPVCGSSHHPRPAKSAGPIPDEHQLKDQQQLVRQAELECEAGRRILGELETDYKTLLNRQQHIEQELGPASAVSLSQLTAQEQAAAQSCKEAEEADRRVKKLDRLISELEEQIKTASEVAEQAEKSWQQAELKLRTAEAVANERLLAVPAEYRDPAALANAQAKAAERQLQLKAAFEDAQTKLQAASQHKVKIQTALESVQANQNTVAQKHRNAEEDFGRRLIKAGFENVSDYRQAKKPEDYIRKLEDRLVKFDGELAAAKDRAQRARREIEGIEQPDMEAINQHLTACQAKYSTVLADYTARKTLVERQAQWLTKLTSIAAQSSEIEKSYGLIGRLAEVANGNNPFRLTFQRFVLGALLDDVATAANERLKTMSRGRYLLQRTMDRARKNAAGGLELEVFDSYTGAARGVSTLSGGETFLASLSLALGLADVVQSYAGGIHLDTILVDEGFGTLDPESLDFAIRALLDLQRGGRLVGIISHVPELKERIDARLEVVPTERGSKAFFKVG